MQIRATTAQMRLEGLLEPEEAPAPKKGAVALPHSDPSDQGDDGFDFAPEGATDLLRADEPSPWVTALELSQTVPENPEWVVEGYIARGAITELSAKIKTGKTHFALDLAAAVLDGREFLGHSTVRVPVIYLTEERRPTFRSVLARVGLEQFGDLHILFRQTMHAFDWSATGDVVLEQAREVGAGLVICDTLPDWASLSGDSENDSGAALEAMRPLQKLAAENLAVLVLRHERKSGGAVGEAARGSTAFGGAVDVLVSLRRSQGQGHENRRELEAVGRFDSIPARLIVELQESHYVGLGGERDVDYRETMQHVLEVLPGSPEHAVPEALLLEAPQVTRTTLQRVLADLVKQGAVSRKKGVGAASTRAYGFWLATPTEQLPS